MAPLWVSPMSHAVTLAPRSLGASPDVHRPYWASTSALSIGLSAPSAPISALDTTWSGVHCWELEGFDFLRPRGIPRTILITLLIAVYLLAHMQ